MTTATEVMERIEERLAELQAAAADRCIEAMATYGDREQYCEAIREAVAFKAVRSLRDELIEEIEPDEPPKPRRRRRKAA